MTQKLEVRCCGRTIRRTVSGTSPVKITCPSCKSTDPATSSRSLAQRADASQPSE